MRGNGPRPGQTLLTLPEGDGVGDWVGEARGLVSCVLAWTKEKNGIKYCDTWALYPWSNYNILSHQGAPTEKTFICICMYLWSVIRFVEFSWLAGPLLYAVVLARVPLDQRGVLGRLWSIGDTELHDHHPRPGRWYAWESRDRQTDRQTCRYRWFLTLNSDYRWF